MNPRVTIALAVIVALVGVYIVAVDRPQAQRAEEAKHLVHVSKTTVTQIVLRNAKGEAALTRVDASHWEVTRPFDAPASSFAVSDLIDAVLGIVPQRTVVKAAGPVSYGLTKPDAEIALRTSDGKTVTVALGKNSPVASGVYARAVPGDAVYLVDTSVRDAISKSASDLRQKTLADFANADVQHVRITSQSGVLSIDRLGESRWRLAGPHPWPADDFKVTDLFFPATTSDAKAFHDGVRDLAPYGLDHPAVTMEVTLKNRPAPLRLLFAAQGKITYAMVAPSRPAGGAGGQTLSQGQAGTPTVLQLEGGLITRLAPSPIALVSKRVLPYNPKNLTAVTWNRDGKALQVRRQGPGFAGGGLTDSEITGMFSSINLLEADTVEALSAAPGKTPAFSIQTDGGEDAQFRVSVYRGPDGKWLASNPGLGLLYRLPSGSFDSFPKPITAFLGIAKTTAASPATKPAKTGGAAKPGAVAPAATSTPRQPAKSPAP